MKEIGAGLVRIPGLVARCGWVITVLCWYGVLIGGSTLAARFRGSPRGRGLYDGDRWVRMLTSLGPSHIKIGQLLSVRRDLLSDAVTIPLARLTDGAKPPSPRRIERAARRAFADRPWPLWEFGWQPVASGSIATVHEAITTDGRRVAVKLRSRNRKKNYPTAGGLDE